MLQQRLSRSLQALSRHSSPLCIPRAPHNSFIQQRAVIAPLASQRFASPRWYSSAQEAQQKAEEPSKEEIQEAPALKEELPKDWHYKKDQPKELILGETLKGVTIRSFIRPLVNLAFITQIESKSASEALKDEYWVLSIQEELNQFQKNKVWKSHYWHQVSL